MRLTSILLMAGLPLALGIPLQISRSTADDTLELSRPKHILPVSSTPSTWRPSATESPNRLIAIRDNVVLKARQVVGSLLGGVPIVGGLLGGLAGGTTGETGGAGGLAGGVPVVGGLFGGGSAGVVGGGLNLGAGSNTGTGAAWSDTAGTDAGATTGWGASGSGATNSGATNSGADGSDATESGATDSSDGNSSGY